MAPSKSKHLDKPRSSVAYGSKAQAFQIFRKTANQKVYRKSDQKASPIWVISCSISGRVVSKMQAVLWLNSATAAMARRASRKRWLGRFWSVPAPRNRPAQFRKCSNLASCRDEKI